MSASAARTATREACRMIALHVARTYVDGARASRELRDMKRAACSCMKCRALRGLGRKAKP